MSPRTPVRCGSRLRARAQAPLDPARALERRPAASHGPAGAVSQEPGRVQAVLRVRGKRASPRDQDPEESSLSNSHTPGPRLRLHSSETTAGAR